MKKNILGALIAIMCAHDAIADIAVIGNPSASAMTAEQISDIYLGKSQVAKPIDLPEGNSLRDEFYHKATGKEPSQVKALWARLIFTGKAPPPKEVSDPSAVKKAVLADAKAVGYIDSSAVDSTVKIFFIVR